MVSHALRELRAKASCSHIFTTKMLSAEFYWGISPPLVGHNQIQLKRELVYTLVMQNTERSGAWGKLVQRRPKEEFKQDEQDHAVALNSRDYSSKDRGRMENITDQKETEENLTGELTRGTQQNGSFAVMSEICGSPHLVPIWRCMDDCCKHLLNINKHGRKAASTAGALESRQKEQHLEMLTTCCH